MPRQFGEPLSEREDEVFALALLGHSSKEIAATLHLSHHYIDQLRGRILRKLGADNMRQIRAWAATLVIDVP